MVRVAPFKPGSSTAIDALRQILRTRMTVAIIVTEGAFIDTEAPRVAEEFEVPIISTAAQTDGQESPSNGWIFRLQPTPSQVAEQL